jgi:ABC-type lipopolysaccharide export system ATPase subunit
MIHKLEADSIQLCFAERTILSNIYLSCSTGEITGLLGRNGQGKSCLLNIIYGTLPTESKSIRFDNISIYNAYKRPDLLVFLPQFNFIPKFLSLKNIFTDFQLDFSLFEKEFPAFKTQYKSSIGSFSGGERRLIELYTILNCTSQFAMMDEPFTHLSPLQIEKVKELLIQGKARKGLIITDHCFHHVIDISDTLYLLKDGKTHHIKNVEEIEELGYARL